MRLFLVLCLMLSVADAFVILAAAREITFTVATTGVPSSYNPPASSPSPSNRGKHGIAQGPTIRKLWKNRHKEVKSLAEAPQTKEHMQTTEKVSPSNQETQAVEAQEIRLDNYLHHHHHSTDKSIAGGGVILGGLATTFLVAIFCYIRATRRKSAEPAPEDTRVVHTRAGDVES